ncbi:hypothetical protein SMICM17S_08109 [Streptomyces microflavus]
MGAGGAAPGYLVDTGLLGDRSDQRWGDGQGGQAPLAADHLGKRRVGEDVGAHRGGIARVVQGEAVVVLDVSVVVGVAEQGPGEHTGDVRVVCEGECVGGGEAVGAVFPGEVDLAPTGDARCVRGHGESRGRVVVDVDDVDLRRGEGCGVDSLLASGGDELPRCQLSEVGPHLVDPVTGHAVQFVAELPRHDSGIVLVAQAGIRVAVVEYLPAVLLVRGFGSGVGVEVFRILEPQPFRYGGVAAVVVVPLVGERDDQPQSVGAGPRDGVVDGCERIVVELTGSRLDAGGTAQRCAERVGADHGGVHDACRLERVVDPEVGGVVGPSNVLVQAEPVQVGACEAERLTLQCQRGPLPLHEGVYGPARRISGGGGRCGGAGDECADGKECGQDSSAVKGHGEPAFRLKGGGRRRRSRPRPEWVSGPGAALAVVSRWVAAGGRCCREAAAWAKRPGRTKGRAGGRRRTDGGSRRRRSRRRHGSWPKGWDA